MKCLTFYVYGSGERYQAPLKEYDWYKYLLGERAWSRTYYVH
jgi:hypothetical protein